LLQSDFEVLYNKRPDDPDARVIGLYRRKTEIIVGNKSRVGRGGIEAKIQAALNAAEAGVAVVIASGYGRDTILHLMEGRSVGTLILKSTYGDEQEGPEIITQRTKAASAILRNLSSTERSQILFEVASQIRQNSNKILEANKKDIELAEKYGTSPSLVARLKLSSEKLESLVVGIQQIAQAADPVGRLISANQLADGLVLTQETTPLGVLLVIFESRPDAVPQLAALAIKSANGLLLKGGKEAQHSNQILHEIIGQAIVKSTNGKLSSDVIGLIQSREDINVLLSFEKDINLVIPRGSNKLVSDIQNATKIPVLGHSEGICHIYVHSDADIQKAIRVIVDAKLDYPAACNAVESLLLNKELIQGDRAFKILSALAAAKIQLCAPADLLSYAEGKGLKLQSLVHSFHHEYGEPMMTVSFIENFDAAVKHINEYGSSHTESILTESTEVARQFQNRIDSACVFHNASTRFADGFRFGLGAEVGISTNRIHARGPVGVEGLLSTKWKLTSTSPNGDIASEFSNGSKKWLHTPLNPAKL
jgi:delta-1-pyrroline-5-carboxylate synthetase